MKKTKKDSMGREIRESMKEVIREHGFGYWFKEVFWYHYGKLSIALLAALIVAIYLMVDAAGKPRYDFHMVIAMDAPIADAFTQELQDVVTKAVGDINGDGEILLDLQIIDLGDEENMEANQQRLQVVFAQSEYTLYIMDDMYSATYCHREYFDPAEDYGFTPDPTEDRRVDINELPLIQRLEEQTLLELDFYACICDWTVDGKGNTKLTEAAVRALNAIIEAE